ncbi:hypothetical protein [Streptomyces alboflavus]|uniref:hypothetical protein n=1 Tax=Streptomyces alboflavus TaxID=67267 RepID=UPI003699261F
MATGRGGPRGRCGGPGRAARGRGHGGRARRIAGPFAVESASWPGSRSGVRFGGRGGVAIALGGRVRLADTGLSLGRPYRHAGGFDLGLGLGNVLRYAGALGLRAPCGHTAAGPAGAAPRNHFGSAGHGPHGSGRSQSHDGSHGAQGSHGQDGPDGPHSSDGHHPTLRPRPDEPAPARPGR